jgi:hypothetical protein
MTTFPKTSTGSSPDVKGDDELDRLYDDGAISKKSVEDPGASFMPTCCIPSARPTRVRLVNVPGEADQDIPGGKPPPGVYVPGKPYMPTEAQHVRVPRRLSRQHEQQFLAHDLEEASDIN